MTTELQIEKEKAAHTQASIPARRVCMHVLTAVRTDARVMRSATALQEAGYAVSVVDIVDEYSEAREEIRGITVKHVKISRAFFTTRFKRWVLLRTALVFLRSTLLLLRTPADIYHAHDFTGLPASSIAAFLRRKPLIFDAHELPLSELDVPHRRLLRLLLLPLLSRMIARSAGGIGAAPLYAELLQQRYHIKHVTLLRNFPPYRQVERSDLLRQRLKLDPATRIVLYQGNIQADRRLDIIIRAAAFLEDKIVVVLLGKGIEPTFSQLQELVAQKDVAERVKFLPQVPYDELLDWTSSADLGLTLIPPDGTLNMRTCLPNKLFEYLMAGIPVLASPMDAVAPLVTGYEVGRVVPSLEPADLGAAISSMLKDTAELARMRKNALSAAAREFCWDKEQARLLQLYQTVLAKGS